MFHRFFAAVCFVFALLAPAVAAASCGSDDCPLSLHSNFGGSRRASLDLSYQYIDQDQVWVGSSQGTVGELPSPEDEVRTRTSTIVAAGQLAVTDRISVSATLPFMDRMHQHIANEEG